MVIILFVFILKMYLCNYNYLSSLLPRVEIDFCGTRGEDLTLREHVFGSHGSHVGPSLYLTFG